MSTNNIQLKEDVESDKRSNKRYRKPNQNSTVSLDPKIISRETTSMNVH